MGLELYKKKRYFKNTPETAAKKEKSQSKLSFVVQRHKASHLHYDFRLELNGVLKSWAVPRGPSLNPKDKRLAMMVEDHPYSYKDFEGIIPEGNYGAGIVEIWDKGELSDMDNSDKKTAEKNLKAALKKGDLKFRLHGRKLKGEFVLVHMKGRGENNWLLIKHRDKYALDEEYNSEERTPKNSPINKWLSKRDSRTKKAGGKTETVKKSAVGSRQLAGGSKRSVNTGEARGKTSLKQKDKVSTSKSVASLPAGGKTETVKKGTVGSGQKAGGIRKSAVGSRQSAVKVKARKKTSSSKK